MGVKKDKEVVQKLGEPTTPPATANPTAPQDFMTSEDFQRILKNCIFAGIKDGISENLKRTYNSPIESTVKACLEANESAFRSLFTECISSCVNDAEFRKEVITQTRAVMAKTLVARFGGEVEKQVNDLKSNPATRARITLALEEIVANPSVQNPNVQSAVPVMKPPIF